VPSADLPRTAIATVLALCGSTLATFVASTLLRKGRPSFADMANAALAGGVAVGATCNVIGPTAAFVVGLLAGTLCTVGYVVIQPRVDAALKIVDTCGVHNLHGMPACWAAWLRLWLVPGIAKAQLIGIACTVLLAFVSGSVSGYVIALAGNQGSGRIKTATSSRRRERRQRR